MRDGFLIETKTSALVSCEVTERAANFTMPEYVKSIKDMGLSNLRCATVFIPASVKVEEDAFFDNKYIKLVACPKGSSAEKEAATETDITVLTADTMQDTNAFEVLLEKYNQGTEKVYKATMEKAYIDAQCVAQATEIIKNANLYRAYLEKSATLEEGESILAYALENAKYKGTELNVSALLDRLAQNPKGKVLPVYLLTADDYNTALPERLNKQKVDFALLAALPDELRPTDLSEVEYLLEVHSKEYYAGSYYGAGNAIGTKITFELINAKTGETIKISNVTSGPAPTTTFYEEDFYLHLPSGTEQETAILDVLK